ncbi:hypothetical protein [Kineococcus aurantiacus]|uniref:Uncharacterized protein n=1 Tax=Kineococcus aurantiacus TaxID=37633 RepID=A0A7Y9J2Y3_9ACTN|nr:hypothetical protein [Kineococcus aurantiacus]
MPVLSSLEGGRAHVIAIDDETVHALRLQRATCSPVSSAGVSGKAVR